MKHEVPWLRAGTGETPADGGCILQVIDWVHSGGWSDEPFCVHYLLHEIAAAANDYTSDRKRQKLLAMAPKLMASADASWPVRQEWRKMLNRIEFVGGLMTLIPKVGYRLGGWYAFRNLTKMLDMLPPRPTPEMDYRGVCEVLPEKHKRELVLRR